MPPLVGVLQSGQAANGVLYDDSQVPQNRAICPTRYMDRYIAKRRANGGNGARGRRRIKCPFLLWWCGYAGIAPQNFCENHCPQGAAPGAKTNQPKPKPMAHVPCHVPPAAGSCLPLVACEAPSAPSCCPQRQTRPGKLEIVSGLVRDVLPRFSWSPLASRRMDGSKTKSSWRPPTRLEAICCFSIPLSTIPLPDFPPKGTLLFVMFFCLQIPPSSALALFSRA